MTANAVVNGETLQTWARKDTACNAHSEHRSTVGGETEVDKFAQLRAENVRLRVQRKVPQHEREVLRKADHVFREGGAVKTRWTSCPIIGAEFWLAAAVPGAGPLPRSTWPPSRPELGPRRPKFTSIRG
jgi:hypothetical protein